MRYISNRAFSLVEILVTVAILSTAIIFVFRSFATSLYCAKLSQDITFVGLLAENKLWDIEQKQKASRRPLERESGEDEIDGKKIKWSYTIAKLEGYNLLVEAAFNFLWEERLKEKEYALNLLTYLSCKQ
ncbi:MAG: type II secretion system GspH family protein [Candidatus Omnitrophica bacterium]|nr:type II secretion system GspH family protein [Candidatus Omnitrophota bacterium]